MDGSLTENSANDEITLLEAVQQAQEPPSGNATHVACHSNDTPGPIWPFQLECNESQRAFTCAQTHSSQPGLELISNDAESAQSLCQPVTTDYEDKVIINPQSSECFPDNIDPQVIFNPSTIAHITQNMMTAMGLPYLGDLTPSFTSGQPHNDELINGEFVAANSYTH
ncbi:hypothetical protein H4R34_002002 [Dimargaris verticillata]|uniref:Uncharacterized protein n=1 Tax=Dimargaris verticillata TaxID=2761393 RepID=A0A9W8EEH1_9FUNG|nr:hypothetical protein H4R34_002002 [Dimargaris verticillata]